MGHEVLLGLGATVLGVLVAGGLALLLVFVIRRAIRTNRAHYADVKAAAAAYGLRPPGRVSIDALPWLRHLPDQGQGQVTKMFVGERGGRPVAVVEYLYSKPSAGNYAGTGRLYLAAVQTPGPLPRQRGPGQYGTWFTAGTDVAVYADGELVFPFILGAVDELLGVAGRLTA